MEKCLDFLDCLNTWHRGLEYDNITLDEAINEAMEVENKILSLQQKINELKHENAVLAGRLFLNGQKEQHEKLMKEWRKG